MYVKEGLRICLSLPLFEVIFVNLKLSYFKFFSCAIEMIEQIVKNIFQTYTQLKNFTIIF